MIVTLESTDKIVKINGIPQRIWEGTTNTGIKVHCFISRMGISIYESKENIAQFEKELTLQRTPSPEIDKIPTRLIL